MDAGQIARPFRVDRHQARVRVRRAEHRGVEHAGHLHVVDESPRAGDEPIAAEAWMSLTDHRDILALCPARLYQAGTAGRVDVSGRR
jgi:hypothetical protein